MLLPSLLAGPALSQQTTSRPQFSQPTVQPTGGQVASVVTGDFQNLGITDILYIDTAVGTGATSQVMAGQLLRQGFDFSNLTENQITFPAVSNVVATIADLNGDHIVDYAFALTPTVAGGNDLCIYYGTGTGTTGSSSYGNHVCSAFAIQGSLPPSFAYIASAGAGTPSGPHLFLEDVANGYLYVLADTGTATTPAYTVVFSQALPLGAGAGPLYTADLNGDGVPDLVLNGVASHTAAVYLLSAAGALPNPAIYTFSTQPANPVSNNVRSLLLSDMDGDGHPDLVAESATGSIQIFHGNADGTFAATSEGGTAAANAADGSGGRLVAIADLNGDGLPDILSATPAGLSVLLGGAGHGFTLAGIYNVGPGRSSFATLQFTGAGAISLVVDSPEGVAIVYGNGDGTFQSSRAYSAGLPALGSTVGRFRNATTNPAGALDVVVATTLNQGQLMVGDGAGNFAAAATPANPTVTAASSLWSFVQAGDFDGDGNRDLLYTATGLPQPAPGGNVTGLAVSYGNGDGTFTAAQPIAAAQVSAPADDDFFGQTAVGDLNGDGHDDLAMVDARYDDTLLGQSRTSHFQLGLNTNYAASATASFNQAAAGFFAPGRTAKQDLLIQQGGSIVPYVNSGDGKTFTLQPTLSGTPDPHAYTLAALLLTDLDGDGFADAVGVYRSLASSQAQLSVWYGKGDGTFVTPVVTQLTRNYFLAASADMNNDGQPDLILSDGAVVAILYNQSARSFGTVQSNGLLTGEQHFLAGQGINSLSVADVNNDGSPDLIVANGGASLSNPIALGATAPGATSIALAQNPDVNTGGITVLLNRVVTRPITGVLTVAPEPSDYGAAFTLNVTLTPSAGIAPPTGSVAFAVDGISVGTAQLAVGAASSTAGFTVALNNSISVGAHSLTAAYNGDTYNSPLTVTTPHSVLLGATTTNLNLCVGPTPTCPSGGLVNPPYVPNLTMFYGQTFNGTASAYADDGSLLTGTISLIDTYNGASSDLCDLSVVAGSQCPPSVGSGTQGGLNVFTAVYTGDAGHARSTSLPVNIFVQPDVISPITLTSAPNPSVQGQAVVFTTTLTGSYAAPTGNVFFFDYGTGTSALTIGTVVLTPGTGLTSTATFTTSTLAVGTHNIQVAYAGTIDFQSATSPFVKQVVLPLSVTAIALTSSNNPSLVGQAVRFTATVSAGSTAVVPTGSVSFYDAGALIGTGVLTATGTASFTTSTLTAGTHSITAQYSGDTFNTPSASAAFQQVVTAPPAPGSTNFTVVVTPVDVIVGVGASANLTVTVTPLNNFTQGVTLACAGLPPETTCSFANANIAPGGGYTVLTLKTTAPHDCGSNQPYFIGSSSGSIGSSSGGGPPAGPARILPFALPTLAGLGVLFVPGRRRWLRALVLLAAVVGALQITGCGTCTDLGTRPNVYSFQVTGTASGGTPETESQAIPLDVTL